MPVMIKTTMANAIASYTVPASLRLNANLSAGSLIGCEDADE